MKLKVITLTNQLNHPGFLKLKQSLDHFGYDWHCIETEWKGFGTKIIKTAEYLETIRNEYSHFIFVDAHDCFFLDYVQEQLLPITYGLISTEKAIWPDSSLSNYYPIAISPWRYVNSGSYYMPIELFLKIVEQNPIEYTDDDQLWLTKIYLSYRYALELDYDQRIFASMAFEADNDFTYHMYHITNNITGKDPLCLHYNGRTDMSKGLEILNNILNNGKD